MKRKSIIIAISFFLAILFLSTIGSIYTGYATLDQSRLTLKYYPYPFVKNNVPNDVYVVIPYDYRYNEFKVAVDIAESLKGNNLVAPSIVTDKEVPEGNHNFILIGNPCNNNLIANELATLDCSLDLKKGQALITILNHQRTSTIVLSSYNSEDLEKAAIVLTNYKFYPFMKNKIVVSGDVGNLVLDYY